MKLSDGEKLILLALADQKDGKEEIDLDFIRSAIFNGHSWALSWQYPGIATEETEESIVKETADILGMWSYIEHSVKKLPSAEQDQLAKNAHPYDLTFSGFDGNHDKHHSVASFLINNMDRFSEFKGRSLNSHSQMSLPSYRRMLPAYNEEVQKAGFGGRSLTAESIEKIIKG
ncbi:MULTISPECIES: YfbU family protein [Rhizobium/Agrobacterium group]|uniref:YfbU family protein n=1 Tax=Rhizobium/Agrobacterium group TaxID=227290 RepID=UPI002FBD5274